MKEACLDCKIILVPRLKSLLLYNFNYNIHCNLRNIYVNSFIQGYRGWFLNMTPNRTWSSSYVLLDAQIRVACRDNTLLSLFCNYIYAHQSCMLNQLIQLFDHAPIMVHKIVILSEAAMSRNPLKLTLKYYQGFGSHSQPWGMRAVYVFDKESSDDTCWNRVSMLL